MQILTTSGYKHIDDCVIGEQLVAYDVYTGLPIVNTLEAKRELRVENLDEESFYWVRINGSVTLFAQQSIWVNDNQVVHAHMLQVGDTIYDLNDQPLTISSFETNVEGPDVWHHLSVSGDSSFVSSDLTLHNASRYWVGGGSSTNYNATGNTNWSSSSGGANNASVPGNADDAIWNGSSGSGTCTINTAVACLTANFTGFTGTLTSSGQTLSIYGNCTLASGMTLSGTVIFGTRTNASAFTSAGKSVYQLSCGTVVANTTTLQDDLSSTLLLVNSGATLAFNSRAVTSLIFTLSASSSVVSGSGSLTITYEGTAFNNSAGGTFSNTITINFTDSGNNALTFAGGGKSYGTVTFERGASTGDISITGNNTFVGIIDNGTGTHNLKFPSGGTTTLTSNTNNQALNVNSLNWTNRTTIDGGASGHTITLSNGASKAVAYHCIIQNMTITGTVTTYASYDGGSNSGWSFGGLYWIGGTNNFTGSGSRWSFTSGGTGNNVVTPDLYDTVYFDANSGSGNCTVDANITINNLICTGFTGTLTKANRITLLGPTLTLGSGMTLSDTGSDWQINPPSGVTTSVDLGGKTLATTFWLNGGAGNVTLTNNFNSTASINASGSGSANLNFNGYNVTCDSISGNNPTITLGSGTITLTGTGTVWGFTGTTVTANTSTIKCTSTGSAITFAGNGKTFNNLWFDRGASTSVINITGANTFAELKDTGTAAHTLRLPASTTTTVTTFTVNGTQNNEITIDSSSAGSAATLSKASGTVNCDWIKLKDNTASGGATFNATNTVNQGNVTGWNITSPPVYFIGNDDTANLIIVRNQKRERRIPY